MLTLARRAVGGALAVAAIVALSACGAGGTGGQPPSAAAPSPPATSSPRPAASSPPGPALAPTPAPPASAGLPGFAVLSMSFVSDEQGFALGTAGCGAAPLTTGRCLALLGTADGGATWRQLTAPARTAGGQYGSCAGSGPCVAQIRFATPLTGYAFGPALLVTTDGGHRWSAEPGVNTSSLEAADGMVTRVVSAALGCAGQPWQAQSVLAGQAGWTALPAPPITMICQPALYRQGQRLVLASYGNAAGGVRATARLDRSADGGRTWAAGPDACGGTDGYASAVALAPPDVLVLLCQHQGVTADDASLPAYVRVSVNGGASYGPARLVPSAAAARPQESLTYQLAAASSGRLLVVETGEAGSRVLLTEDGGTAWTPVLSPAAGPGVLLVGYEDPSTGRIAQGGVVWTTRDGGRTWAADRF